MVDDNNSFDHNGNDGKNLFFRKMQGLYPDIDEKLKDPLLHAIAIEAFTTSYHNDWAAALNYLRANDWLFFLVDNIGETILHFFAAEGPIEAFDLLSQLDVDRERIIQLLIRQETFGFNVLRSAVYQNNLAAVEKIIDLAGVHVFDPYKDNNSIVHSVANLGDMKIFDLLIKHADRVGIDIFRLKNGRGDTVFHNAASAGNLVLFLNLFLLSGDGHAMLKVKNEYGKTPMDLGGEKTRQFLDYLYHTLSFEIDLIDRALTWINELDSDQLISELLGVIREQSKVLDRDPSFF